MPPPNYTPTAAPGDTRRRIFRVQAENPNEMSMTPEERAAFSRRIDFFEEEVIRRHDGFEVPLGPTRKCELIYNPNAHLPLKNPLNDSELLLPGLGSSVPMSLAFAILYSLGRYAQSEADKA